MPKPFVRFGWAIKKLLRSKANFLILEGFLSELLTSGKDLKIVNLLESESNKENKKGITGDILVKKHPSC